MHPASPRGFAAVARDHAEAPLDLHRLMVPRPAATFFVKMRGDSMQPSLRSGDLLVVDRSLDPCPGRLVIATMDGSFIVRRWERARDGGILLRADNPGTPSIRAADVENFQVWGVVTWVVKDTGSGSG